jgi:hypothetical protein
MEATTGQARPFFLPGPIGFMIAANGDIILVAPRKAGHF